MTKRCVGCGDYKDEEEYYASGSTEDGLNRYCKQCCKVNRALEAVRKRDKTSKVSIRQRVRAQGLGVEFDTDILLVNVFKRYKGICAICGLWVPAGKASLDHTKPLSKGGTHTHDNVQLAHLRCNLRKGARE